MPDSSISYIRLKPTEHSELSLNDAKELLSYLEAKTNTELVIKSDQGSIQLFIGHPKTAIDSLVKHLYSLSPELVISKVKRSEALLAKVSLTNYYRLNKHYAYPVFNPDKAEGDELIKFLRHLTLIGPKDAVELRFSITPSEPLKARLLKRRLLAGSLPPSQRTGVKSLPPSLILATLNFLNIILKLLAGLFNPSRYLNNPNRVVNKRSVILLDKLFEPLFKTSLEVKIKSPSQKQALKIKKDIEDSLNSFADAVGYQKFSSCSNTAKADIYSASDLAAFFNFSSSDLKSGIYSLEQVKHLPNSTKPSRHILPGDVVAGFNTYQGIKSDLVLSQADRFRHVYISGATGSGKSTLLANLALQDIVSGQGLTLIDPHGDLAKEVYSRIPASRADDVMYFDSKADISINLLDHKYITGSSGYNAEADQIVESIISMFRKIFGEELSGHRIEYILRNSIQTALTIPGSTIFTIYRLLTDRSFRLSVVPKLTNQDLINFWQNELGRAGEYQRVKMTAGVTAKIGRFLFSDATKRAFGQSVSNLDINDVINSNKILICNFSKGDLGEDGSKLFATALLTKLQLAALAKSQQNEQDRTAHYLYVDEFQTYAPSVLIQMLSEARKYALYLTMAEQSPSQQDSQSTSVLLANIGNLVCFRTSSLKDAKLLLPNFTGYLEAVDLINLPAYHFYLKTTAEQSLPPTSGQSYPLDKGLNLDSTVETRRPLQTSRQASYKLRRAI